MYRHIVCFADLYCSSSHAAFCLCGDGSNMALYHTSICWNWYAEQFPLSACKFQLSEYRWNEFLDTACYFDFGRNWIICVYILGDSFLLQTSGSIKEVQNRMNWLSAARRLKKKSRRRADTFSRAYETAALIFRAAVSLRLHKPIMNFPEILWLIAI